MRGREGSHRASADRGATQRGIEMQGMSKRWRTILAIIVFCLMFGGAAIAPVAVGATGTYPTTAYQGAPVYLPPSPCRVYYAAY